ncbi:MAG: chloride channel protein [Deltaproteobacteria bacterium]|nr:chloride channel protein [Deltaproteobacteria bacterium]
MSNFIKGIRKTNYRRILKVQLEVRPYLQGIPYWTAAVLVGLFAVMYSGLFGLCIETARNILAANPYLLYVTSPLCFVIAAWMVSKFAPAAGGPGVTQVIYALSLDPTSQKVEIERYLNLRVLIVVMISSLFCMLGAGALGREGPMVHMAACIFYFVGRQFHRFWPQEEHRSWIIAGGAAGIAAAFNAPLAGVVFVLEELAQQHFHRFKSVVITAAIIGGVVSQWLSDRYLYFGYPKIGEVPLSSIPWAIFVGILCGILAYPFHRMLLVKWETQVPSFFKPRLRFALLVGVLIATLAIFVNPGTIGGGVSVIQDLLFKEGERASWSLIIGRFFATLLSHLSGCAGGFLAPSLGLGAAIGSKAAVLSGYANHNLLVIVGMAAFLSAIIRAPFTAWVIVMEMTDRHSAIFPLMVASLISCSTAKFLVERPHRTSGKGTL